MNEEIDELNSSLRDIRLENEEEIEFLRSKVVSKAPVKSWFDFYRVMHENLSLAFLWWHFRKPFLHAFQFL